MKNVIMSSLLLVGGQAHGDRRVSPEVRGSFVGWAESRESAPWLVAAIEFTNASDKKCTVERYALHWSEGSYEGTPKGLDLLPRETTTRNVQLGRIGRPADNLAVVQVWKTTCR